MRSWISDRVKAYCQNKFLEASSVIDEQVVKAVVRCEDQLTDIILNSDVKFKKEMEELKVRISEEIRNKEAEMITLIEKMDVNAELSKCFASYVEKSMLTLHPAIAMTPQEMKGYKKMYELELIRMSSFQGEGSSAMTGTTAKLSLANRSADERGLSIAIDKARESGGKIGAEIAYIYSVNYSRGPWKESSEDQTCSSSSTVTASIHFYRIKREKDLEDEDITKDEGPEDSSVSSEDSYSELVN